jgi:hypothetical protein
MRFVDNGLLGGLNVLVLYRPQWANCLLGSNVRRCRNLHVGRNYQILNRVRSHGGCCTSFRVTASSCYVPCAHVPIAASVDFFSFS